jgi:hypothetical protein
MTITVAVLSDQSLLMQGIISRLQSSVPAINLLIAETGKPDVVEQWIALQPDMVILESKELSDPSIFPLNRLFANLPQLVVLEVNIETSTIQMIRSNQYSASGVADLLNVLQNASGNIPGVFSSIKPA